MEKLKILIFVLTIPLILIGCDDSSEIDAGSNSLQPNSSTHLELLRSVTFNTIFFDLTIDGEPYRGTLQPGQRFPIGTSSTVDIEVPTTELTNGSHDIVVEFCHIAAGSSDCRLIAILEQTIQVSNSSGTVSLGPENYTYPDRDGNGRRDIFDITIDVFLTSVEEQTYSRVRLDTEGYTNGFGPDMDVLTGSDIVTDLHSTYGFTGVARDPDAPQLQIVQPRTLDDSALWEFGSDPPDGDVVGPNDTKAPYYLFEINSDNGVCAGNFSPNSVSSIRSNAQAGLNQGILLMLFRKDNSEYMVPMTFGSVGDLSSFKIGNAFDESLLNVNLDLNDSLVAVLAPLGTVGWFTAWQDPGNSDSSPNCSFNITSPPLVSE